MKRRSFLRIGCVLLGALLLGVSAGRAAVALAENKRLRDGFVKHPYLVYPYEEHIPMEEMDISQLTGAMDILAVAAAETDNRFLLTLTRDICYYDKANAAKPALILKKGTRVYPWLTGDPWFYGFSSSLPTYYHGWRYNRPLLCRLQKRLILRNTRDSSENMLCQHSKKERLAPEENGGNL